MNVPFRPLYNYICSTFLTLLPQTCSVLTRLACRARKRIGKDANDPIACPRSVAGEEFVMRTGGALARHGRQRCA